MRVLLLACLAAGVGFVGCSGASSDEREAAGGDGAVDGGGSGGASGSGGTGWPGSGEYLRLPRAGREPAVVGLLDASAIDIGMGLGPQSREWLKWLIAKIASDEIQGIAEVIGSYDGYDVRYWSDSSGWSTNGVPYTGCCHDTWTHVAIYRSTALDDHGILAGW